MVDEPEKERLVLELAPPPLKIDAGVENMVEGLVATSIEPFAPDLPDPTTQNGLEYEGTLLRRARYTPH